MKYKRCLHCGDWIEDDIELNSNSDYCEHCAQELGNIYSEREDDIVVWGRVMPNTQLAMERFFMHNELIGKFFENENEGEEE